MQKLKLRLALVSIFLLLAHFVSASEQLPLPLHLDVTALTRASAPRIVDNYILFTYAAGSNVRFVGIAFRSQDFRDVHPFYRNQHGVFFYLLPTSSAESPVVYRLIVDGLWQDDPSNSDTITDSSGIVLSRVEIPPRKVQITASPVVRANGAVQFFFKAPANRIVTIAGDFNNWDPFMNQLERTSDGYYTTTIQIPPGTHAYYYVSAGVPIADPLNPRVDYSADGTKLSVFSVP